MKPNPEPVVTLTVAMPRRHLATLQSAGMLPNAAISLLAEAMRREIREDASPQRRLALSDPHG